MKYINAACFAIFTVAVIALIALIVIHYWNIREEKLEETMDICRYECLVTLSVCTGNIAPNYEASLRWEDIDCWIADRDCRMECKENK